MNDWTLLDDLNEELAPLAFPMLSIQDAKRRIRDRISHAEEKGILTLMRHAGDARPCLSRIAFNRWVSDTWPHLAESFIHATDGRLAGVVPSMQGGFRAVQVPSPEEAQQAFVVAQDQLLATQAALDAEKTQRLKAETERDALQHKADERSRKGSEAARRPRESKRRR